MGADTKSDLKSHWWMLPPVRWIHARRKKKSFLYLSDFKGGGFKRVSEKQASTCQFVDCVL